MRSDERLFFYVASGAMTISIIWAVFFHIIPMMEDRHNYVYGHCTITGQPHWEKYDTLDGIKERVIVPVELRIGDYQNALSWNQWNGTGANLLKSSDIYHQAIARDTPNGWEYFSLPDKVDYLAQYAVGREYECWARPNTGYHEVTFSTNQKDLKRLIPQVIFVVILVGLCLATGVCVGLMDAVRSCIGLPPPSELGPDGELVFGYVGGKGQTTYGSAGPPLRQFASEYNDRPREWV